MKLLTFTLVLSLLAFASLCQANERDWDKAAKCAKCGARYAAAFVRSFFPELRTYMICVDYNPPTSSHHCILRYFRAVYELLQRSVLGNINCLLDPLKKAVKFSKPAFAEMDEFKCFD